MRTRLPLLIPFLLLAGSASALAASIQPTPEPGLWLSDSTTLINGVDLHAKLREARDAMLESIPQEQRSLVAQMLDNATDANQKRCITQELAQQLTDPDALLADAHKQMPGCEFSIEQHGDDRLAFNGTCNNKDGFTGTMQGETQMISSREMRSSFTGEGTYQIPEQTAPGLAEQLNGPVKVTHRETSTWSASACGDVPVEMAH